jgi:chromosome segregation ATPase
VNGIKPPGAAEKANLTDLETGLREDKDAANDAEGTTGAMDHLDGLSVGTSHISMGGEVGLNDSGIATEQQLIAEKHRLEDQIVKLNIDVKDKNEKILDLLEQIEDLKIQIYARDKSVELTQTHVEQLMEDLREAKQFEHECKRLQIMNNSLE